MVPNERSQPIVGMQTKGDGVAEEKPTHVKRPCCMGFLLQKSGKW